MHVVVAVETLRTVVCEVPEPLELRDKLPRDVIRPNQLGIHRLEESGLAPELAVSIQQA
jgi:hypothetical protein